jgi:hypothetical protein
MTAADRLHAALTPVNVSLVAVGIVVGTVTGIATAEQPVIQAPHDCQVMATTAERAFVAYQNYATAVELRGVRGATEYDRLDEDAAEQDRLIDELGPAYHEAKAGCLR